MHEMFVQAASILDTMYANSVNPFSRGTIMEPWVTDFVDVPEIHASATREIAALIQQVRKERRSKSRLLIGDVANGKSHVLARIKNTLTDQIFFCFVEPVIGHGHNMFRHILANISRDLFRAAPRSPFAQFERLWRDFFLGVGQRSSERKENVKAWTDNRKTDLLHLIDRQLMAEGLTVDHRFVGLLYEYGKKYRSDSRVRYAVETWIKGGAVGDSELELLEFPFRSSIDTEDKAKEVIKELGAVTLFSRPVFLCFDQIEGYLFDDAAFRAFTHAVEYLREYTHNYAIVVAAPTNFNDKLRSSGVSPSTWDRFNYKAKPIYVHPLTPEEGEQLVAARVAGEMGQAEILREQPGFPFCSRDMDDILTPAGGTGRAQKQARYVLADAEALLDEILAARPSAEDIEYYFSEDWPLHRMANRPKPVFSWPQWADIEQFLSEKLAEVVSHYHAHSDEVDLGDEAYRQILLEILLKALDVETANNSFEITDVTVFHSGKPRGCDFAVTARYKDGDTRTVGVVFCDDSRANVLKGIVKRASELLQSRLIESLIYIRDERAVATRAGKRLLQGFANDYSAGEARVVLAVVPFRALAHLRSLKRLFQFADVGELSMYNARVKRQYKVSYEDMSRYLYQKDRLLENDLFRTLLTGVPLVQPAKS
jgi:hypothetical protein